MGDLDELIGYGRVQRLGDLFRTLAHGTFWFALSYCVIQLGLLIAGVVNGKIAVVTL